MKSLITRLDHWLRHVERLAATLSGGLIAILMLLVCAEVAGRGLFHMPLKGSIDIIEQVMVVLVTLGIAYGQSRFGNVRMTLFSDRYRGRMKWLNETLSLLAAFVVVCLLAKGSWLNLSRAWSNGGDTPEIGIPLWPGIAVVTAALVLLGLRLLLQLTEALRLVAHPKDTSPIFGTTPSQ
ncbi:TRAP transporter small permease [Roseibium aestuarii]|uniref:TRAP transporter small permease protein n=1 Tax=Roseibium aestuarii TaxID=2600299 RepID=A0ABW4JZU7_9HYPH|nr:TRAP transporter small permease [Roseibium aestuarii]